MLSSDPSPFDQSLADAASADRRDWFGTLDQSNFDVQFYERLLLRQPDDVRLLKLLGELYARQGRYDQALVIDQKLVDLRPDDGVAQYNLACSLAVQNVSDKAMRALARALELGYNDFSHLEVDPDLNSLRNLLEFQALLRKYGIDG